MKKSALAFTVLALTTGAFAQVQYSPAPNVPSTLGKPLTLKINFLDEVFDFMIRRVHTLDIENQVQAMTANGITEQKHVAVFSASGALIYQNELNGSDVREYDPTGRNVGMQLVPYTIKISNDGSRYLAFNAISLRNMITLQNDPRNRKTSKAYYDSYYGRNLAIFKVVDNIDAVIFKWDNESSFTGIKSFSVDILSTDIKVDVLGSKTPGKFLAITAGGNIGFGRSSITLDSGEKIHTGNFLGYRNYDDSTKPDGLAFKANYRYGLELNNQFKNKSRLNFKLGASHTFTGGGHINSLDIAPMKAKEDAYLIDKALYESNKAQYEKDELNGKVISNESYKTLTGLSVPSQPDLTIKAEKISRSQTYISPSLDFSMKANKEGKSPKRVGAAIGANIPVKDVLKSERINVDLTGRNKDLINAKIYLNF